jgi:uncharacterized membrane protein YfcA
MQALDPTLTDYAFLGVLLLIAGVAAGLLAGLLGVGGGIVIVPVLFWVLEGQGFSASMAMIVAVGTSLATIIPTAWSSARAHRNKGNYDAALFRAWAPYIFLGALAGGLASFVLDGTHLKLIFGSVALVVALNMAMPGSVKLAASLPQSKWVSGTIGSMIGFVSALMGIGGGTFSVPALTAYSVPTHRAVGTAAAFGLVIAVPGAFGFILSGLTEPMRPPFSLGYVNLAAVAAIVPMTVLFAPVGARLAHALPALHLKRAFAVFLAITAIRMLWSYYG